MAEFSVVIKKKDESDSDASSALVFYDTDESYYTVPKRKIKKEKKKKVSPRKKIKKKDYPKCPICHDVLDERVKRVYSKSISTEVYFPFLYDENDMTAPAPKVKFCYPCYEYLITQWKEYERVGLPHKKRKYRDRSGIRITSIKAEETKMVTQAVAVDILEIEEEKKVKIENERRIIEERIKEEAEKAREEELSGALSQIHEHIEQVDFNSKAHLEQIKDDIEKAIRKHSNRTKDEIQGLKVENEGVRKQVVRLRRELAEMRLEVGKDVLDVKKKICTKGEKKYKKNDEGDNEDNIRKNDSVKFKTYKS